MAVLLGGYGLRVVLRRSQLIIINYKTSDLIKEDEKFVETLPKVDVLVAARDEENVIERLVSRLLSIEYPEEKFLVFTFSMDN